MKKEYWNTMGSILLFVAVIGSITGALLSIPVIVITGIVMAFVAIYSIERTKEPIDNNDNHTSLPGPRFY